MWKARCWLAARGVQCGASSWLGHRVVAVVLGAKRGALMALLPGLHVASSHLVLH